MKPRPQHIIRYQHRATTRVNIGQAHHDVRARYTRHQPDLGAQIARYFQRTLPLVRNVPDRTE